ncbi:MAG: penicillin-binding protein 2 [Rickettsiales bacterium]|jgi:penicillin-binding protein 2|nr:penicillin-binding protein 2 [Rickettsiales bacterium]
MLDNETLHTFDRRGALVFTGVGVCTFLIFARMLQMQVFQYKKYRRISDNNATRTVVIPPTRGRILSSTGAQLAKDESVYRVFFIPEESDNIEQSISEFTKPLELSDKEIDKIRTTIKRQMPFQPVVLRTGIKWEKLAALKSTNIPGLHIEPGFARRYPGKTLAAHVLGYVASRETATQTRRSDTSPFFMHGVAGLEKTQNDILGGQPGFAATLVDATGRVLPDEVAEYRAPVDGHDVTTTINDEVQRAMEAAMKKTDAGGAVAIKIETGEILACASNPAFNADEFRGMGSADYMADLRNNPLKPFMNKTIEGLYPPGSTFKIVVALAALESGLVSPTEKINCPGFWEYGKHRYHCWEKKGHGPVDMIGALKHSCDVYFYQIALRIGIDVIKDMAARLGVAETFDLEIPGEVAGVIPDRAWKQKRIGASWVHGDTIIAGIGQGYVLANIMSLCVMAARAASNRAVVPHIVKDKGTKGQKNEGFMNINLNPDNIKIVMEGMKQVMEPRGTAAGNAININGARMGGKTGTSQVRRISAAERASGVRTQEELDRMLRNHGLFVGVAPIDNPKYAVAAITEHSGGSTQAAYIAAQTMAEILRRQP